MIRAALLDIDGTLVDSNDLHAESWRVTLSQFGFEVSFERVRGLIGMGGDKLLPALTGLSAEDQRAQELSAARRRLFIAEYVPRVHAFPGARRLVERLLEAGLQPVVASSANDDELERLLARGNVSDLLPLATSSDDAERSKPDPDIVRAALARAQLRPNEALMLGDTPYDLEAATRAGVGFVGVRSGGYDDKALHGALAIYRDVADLVAQFERSPFRSG